MCSNTMPQSYFIDHLLGENTACQTLINRCVPVYFPVVCYIYECLASSPGPFLAYNTVKLGIGQGTRLMNTMKFYLRKYLCMDMQGECEFWGYTCYCGASCHQFIHTHHLSRVWFPFSILRTD